MNTLNCTIYDLYKFFKKYPQYIGKIKVNTRHGFYNVKACEITAINSDVYQVTLENGDSIKTSPDHLLFNGDWIKVKNLKLNDTLLTSNGLFKIKDIQKLNYKDDLYDLEVDEVHEFYANNFVSHNSTIIDAFNFAIFGDSLRTLNKNQIVNNLTNGSTQVILEFNCDSPRGNNDFKVIRELNPSSCRVEKDGRDKTRDSIPNTTKYILEVLSGSQEVFRNCIIMRANNTISFMAQGKAEKKRFIESIFNLDIITKMFRSVKDDINLQKRDLDIETKLKEQTENSLLDYEARLKQQKKLVEDSELQHSKAKEDLRNKIKSLSENIESLKEKLKDKKDFTSLEKNLKEEVDRAKVAQLTISTNLGSNLGEQKSVFKEIKNLSKHGAICQECKRPFDKEDLDKLKEEEEKLQAKLAKLKEGEAKLKALTEKAEKLLSLKQKEYTALRDQRYEYQDFETQLKRNEELLKSYRDNLLNLENTLKISNNSNNSILEELIKTTSKAKDDKEQIIKDINIELSKLDIARFILSEEGIRAYIIKKLLDLLNFRIKYYLAKQNSQYTLSFNEVFDDEIENKNGVPVSYHSLSGAESKMLDLSCIWAFRDILKLQGSVSYNVAFYDEILDSSMDSKNSEIVCDILNEFGSKEKQAIYLISHKPDFIKAVSGEVIRLQKQNGITKLIT